MMFASLHTPLSPLQILLLLMPLLHAGVFQDLARVSDAFMHKTGLCPTRLINYLPCC